MSDEFNANHVLDYFYFEGNRFLIDKGVLKDVQVESEIVRIPDTVTEIRPSAGQNGGLAGSSFRKKNRASFLCRYGRTAFGGITGRYCYVGAGSVP